jgi:hypothetical protein
MNAFTQKQRTAMAIGCLAVGLSVAAHALDNDGCTNETLRGDYALRVSGQVFNELGAVVAQRDGIDMVEYDGAGHLTQKDFVFANGVLVQGPKDSTGFHVDESGTYTVNPDCTGMAWLQFPSPAAGIAGAKIEVMFVLSDHGRTMHQIVSSLQPPGPVGAQVAVLANIHADGEKLGSVGRNHDD